MTNPHLTRPPKRIFASRVDRLRVVISDSPPVVFLHGTAGAESRSEPGLKLARELPQGWLNRSRSFLCALSRAPHRTGALAHGLPEILA